jgi:proteic killer suppression protein
VIRTWLHKGLKELHETGNSSKVPAELRRRCETRLEVLDKAKNLNDLTLPGYNPHPLTGTDPLRHAISVSGPWRITFEFRDGDAWRVNLEQYH